MKYMIFDGLLFTKCVLCKAALLPLLYELKHLLTYFGLIAHEILIRLQIYRYLNALTIGIWTEGYDAIRLSFQGRKECPLTSLYHYLRIFYTLIQLRKWIL